MFVPLKSQQSRSLSRRYMLSALIALTVAATGCSDASDSQAAPAAADAGMPVVVPQPGNTTEPAAEAAPAAAAAEHTVAAAVSKSARAPIYIEESNGKHLIAAALKRAQRDNKHVLIEWGGNWCSWCYKLHDVFHEDSSVQPIIHEEFELVLIDQGKNKELMLEYAGPEGVSGFPHLTVLDTSGLVLTNQETGSLETGPRHDPQRVIEFLQQWKPNIQDAEELLSTALARAGTEQKAVLVRVGSPYCGWCTVLSQFIQDHLSVFATDYVDVKIDTMRMKNGEQVASRLQPANADGIPWMVILDTSGKTLATSIGPQGNIGYPAQPQEIAHFVAMLKSTRNRLTDTEIESLAADLTAWRAAQEAK